MPLQSLGDSLGGWSAKRELGRRLAAARVVNAANELATGRFRAVSVRGGTLTVEVSNASARYLLQPEIPRLIATINERVGTSVVQRIKFRLANDV
ncbi:DUF721 domain-containing protein [Candidatus Berkelbacteria bacterium]|nr:DUF721 domain-containing protein [Candidatus Berkelbacteria bacterium]